MNVVLNLLNAEEIGEIKDTFEPYVFEKLNDDNVFKIIDYLKENNVTVIKDMLIMYLDLFIIEYSEFVKKFVQLKNKYGFLLVSKLENNIAILEEII